MPFTEDDAAAWREADAMYRIRQALHDEERQTAEQKAQARAQAVAAFRSSPLGALLTRGTPYDR
jgi:hypothetical protein